MLLTSRACRYLCVLSRRFPRDPHRVSRAGSYGHGCVGHLPCTRSRIWDGSARLKLVILLRQQKSDNIS